MLRVGCGIVYQLSGRAQDGAKAPDKGCQQGVEQEVNARPSHLADPEERLSEIKKKPEVIRVIKRPHMFLHPSFCQHLLNNLCADDDRTSDIEWLVPPKHIHHAVQPRKCRRRQFQFGDGEALDATSDELDDEPCDLEKSDSL